MNPKPQVHPIALAAIAAMAAVALPAAAQGAKPTGTYVAGDFHNHTTCSDGAISMQKMIKRSMDRDEQTPWGLDWFVQAGHGGSGNRNCTLAEDASLATPAYPLNYEPDGVTLQGPQTRWLATNPPIQPKGDVSGSGVNQNMWRWQAVKEFQYPVTEYLAALRNEPLFMGIESVVAGHEHTSMTVITGQIPAAVYTQKLPNTPGYNPLGNADALSQWAYCFDRGVADTSRGAENQWDCAVPGSLNAADPSWSDLARKLIPAGGAGTGERGHNKTVEALKWMKAFHGEGSYYVPAHLERAGPFNPDGNNGFNVEHLRNFHNTAPRVAFGFESQPGHGASDRRGEYNLRRNNFSGTRLDSVGGTTYGGTGVYAAQVGGVWDALLGEGRNWWFFASSDWHNRGAFSVDDRRSDNDFLPGEYQRNYTMVRNGKDRITPQLIVDGLRTGNTYVTSGQLIDRLSFVACASYKGPATRNEAAVEALALNAAKRKTDISVPGCATMGERLQVRAGADVVVAIVVRDPEAASFSPYSFPNPSLLQVGINQPLDRPVLHHVDVIRGLVTGLRAPGSADYAGAWPDDWVDRDNPQQLRPLDLVPAAAKNTTAAVYKTFSQSTWKTAPGDAEYKVMSFRIPAVQATQYVRLRGTNLPPAVPYETDVDGNPLSDLWTNSGSIQFKNSSAVEFPSNFFLRIPCTTVGSNLPSNAELFTGNGIDGCPEHLPTVTIPGTNYTGKAVAFDVAAWSDLWFYANPIFIEVAGSKGTARPQLVTQR